MGTEWLTGLATEFKTYLESQKFVDVFFSCSDGQVYCHRLILALASNFLNTMMNSVEGADLTEIVIMLPDFSAYDISDFVLALYGGPLPSDTSRFEQLFDLFQMQRKPASNSRKNVSDIGEAFGQICSEIEREFYGQGPTSTVSTPAPVKVIEFPPRFVTRRLPANAQLLQVTKPLPTKPVVYQSQVVTTSSSSRLPPHRVHLQQVNDSDLGFDDTPESAEIPQTSADEERNLEEGNTSAGEEADSSSKFFWTCFQCGKRSATQELLKEHMKNVHDAPDARKAVKRKLEEPEVLIPTFNCVKCAVKFGTKEKLEGHKRTFHKNSTECVHCRKIFASSTLLDAHQVNCHKSVAIVPPTQSVPSPAKRISDYPMIPVDDEVVENSGDASSSHVPDSDSQNNGQEVSVCSNIDDSEVEQPEEDNLDEVVEFAEDETVDVSHGATDDVTTGYICSECGRLLDTLSKLNYHNKITHLGQKPHLACPHCPRKFFQRNNLKQHLQLKHSGGDPRGMENQDKAASAS